MLRFAHTEFLWGLLAVPVMIFFFSELSRWKKKALKQAFVADETKADDYFKNNIREVDESYLASLGDYMNK